MGCFTDWDEIWDFLGHKFRAVKIYQNPRLFWAEWLESSQFMNLLKCSLWQNCEMIFHIGFIWKPWKKTDDLWNHWICSNSAGHFTVGGGEICRGQGVKLLLPSDRPSSKFKVKRFNQTTLSEKNPKSFPSPKIHWNILKIPDPNRFKPSLEPYFSLKKFSETTWGPFLADHLRKWWKSSDFKPWKTNHGGFRWLIGFRCFFSHKSIC